MGSVVNQAERRRAQRVMARLPLRLNLESGTDQVADLETVNISASGIYFKSPRFIEPMTKLAMGLELEVPAEGDDPVSLKVVSCHGLVVRVQPESVQPGCDEYEVAVFFTWIDPDGQRVLQQHIDLRAGNA